MTIQIRMYTNEQIYARPDVVKRLYFLTNGGWGRKASAFKTELRIKRQGYYFLAWQDKKIVGWALLCPKYDIGRNLYKDSLWQVGTYVAAPLRKQGIATRLVNRAKAVCEKNRLDLTAAPWTPASDRLFEKTGVRKSDWAFNELSWGDF